MADRPIKMNPKGKYNLDFIDWQNQWQNIADADYDGQQAPSQSPIYGMSGQQFHNLMLQDSVAFRMDQDTIEKAINGMGDKIKNIKKMKIGKTDKECSICVCGFIKGEVIRVLKCNHIFHDKCIVPWLEVKSCCPNCRIDLKE